MPVVITLSTTLRGHVPGYNPVAGLVLPVPEPTTPRLIAGAIGVPIQEVKVVMVNGKQAELDATVAAGDRVAFFPAVGGG